MRLSLSNEDYLKIAKLNIAPKIKSDFLKGNLSPQQEQEILKQLKMISFVNPTSEKYITQENEYYPPLLKEITCPPPVLFYRGQKEILPKPIMAMVGTRAASTYGKSVAKFLARELINAGFAIVSGLASGIDQAAHEQALYTQGKTIGILGHGFHYCYPRENKYLYHEIAKQGILLSEFFSEQPPATWTFPRRNRIISGLSRGVIVIEGSRKSGAMITARFALEQNREIFAVPGKFGEPKAEGPHQLIKSGAKLIHNVEDIFEELQMLFPKRQLFNKPDLFKGEKEILALIDDECSIDELVLKSNLPVNQLNQILIELIIKGYIQETPGKKYLKIPSF